MKIKFKNDNARNKAVMILNELYVNESYSPLHYEGDNIFNISREGWDTLISLGFPFEDIIE